MAQLAGFLFPQYFDNNGNPLNGGKIYAYAAGTLTPQDTYNSASGVFPNANPIILSSSGRTKIFLQNLPYDFQIKNSAGVLIDSIEGVGSSANGGYYTVDNMFQLTNLASGAYAYVEVGGWESPGDGGGGLFYWDGTSTATVNYGTVFSPNSAPVSGRWLRIFSGPVNAKWFDVRGDGFTTDDSNIARAAAYVQSLSNGGTLFFPSSNGTYSISINPNFGNKVTVKMDRGARFSGNGIAVTFAGGFDGSESQHFAANMGIVTFSTGVPKIYPEWWGANGLSAAVAAAGSSYTTIVISEPQTLSGNLTIPSNVNLAFFRDGLIQGNFALYLNGTLEAGPFKIFDVVTVVLGPGSVKACSVQWWGGVLDDSTDNAAILNKAIAANLTCNAPLVIPKKMKYASNIGAPLNFNGESVQSNGSDPFLINTITYASANLHARMYCDEKYLYLCEYTNNKIAVFELSDGRAPRLLQEFAVSAQPRHCYKVGIFLFVACHGAAVIEVYDVSNPGIASLYTSISTGANPKHFIIVGKFLYVVCAGSNTIEKFDISSLYNTASINITRVASLGLGISPLCVSRDEEGWLVVCGLSTGLVFVGELNLNLISTFTLPGNSHGTCVAIGEYVLVTDGVNNQINVVNVQSLAVPQLVTSVATSTAPEMLEVVGNRAYVPSLTSPGVQAYLDCLDITNIRAPYLYKSVPLTVTGGGFIGRNKNLLYVSGHFSPYNIDIIEIEPNTVPNLKQDIINKSGQIADLSFETLNASYATKTTPYTVTIKDFLIRIGLGVAIALPDPAGMPGKIIILTNVHATLSSNITNAFAGFSGTLLAGQSCILQATYFSGTAQWEAVARPIIVTKDLPNPALFGNAVIGTWPFNSGFAMVSHSSLNNAVNGNYGLLQQSDGTTYINAAATKSINFNINGANFILLTQEGYTQFQSRAQNKMGANIASANDITLLAGNYFQITGLTTLNRVLSTGWQAGSVFRLFLPATIVVAHNVAAGSSFVGFFLSGSANWTVGANGAIGTFMYDGTYMRECSARVTF